MFPSVPLPKCRQVHCFEIATPFVRQPSGVPVAPTPIGGQAGEGGNWGRMEGLEASVPVDRLPFLMRCHPGTPSRALRESWLGWFLSGLWSRAAVHMLGGGVTWGEEPLSSQSTAVSYSALILCHSHWGRVSRVGVTGTPFHLWEPRQGSGVGRPPTGSQPWLQPRTE